jgi:hypothetical protein
VLSIRLRLASSSPSTASNVSGENSISEPEGPFGAELTDVGVDGGEAWETKENSSTLESG